MLLDSLEILLDTIGMTQQNLARPGNKEFKTLCTIGVIQDQRGVGSIQMFGLPYDYEILFLLPIEKTDSEVYRDGGYQLLRVWQGELLFHEDEGVYAPYLPAEEWELMEART